MRFGRSRKSNRPPAGEYPRQFTEQFMQRTLPTTSPLEAQSAIAHLRTKGWTEEELAQKILPYMPRPGSFAATPGAATPAGPAVPAQISRDWLDRHLPAMDRGQIRLVVDELERRGWSPGQAAVAVLPHLLPKLPPEDAQAILAGLRELGMSEAEIASIARSDS
jgi:hypothetical protein